MNSTPEYVPYLLAAQKAASARVGVDVYGIDRQSYVMDLTVLTLIAMIIHALHDKNIVLDGEWLTRLQTALDGPWPPNVLNQIDPNAPAR